MLEVDPKMLIDSFVYEEYIEDDKWGGGKHKDPITIENVRIDRTTVYSRDKTQTQILADAVIFCYASDTTPFINFKEQSAVFYDGKRHIVKKIVPIYEPYNLKLWAYELEVI